MAKWAQWLIASVLVSGCTGLEGTAIVEADFSVDTCREDRKRGALADYRFDASYVQTERYYGVFIINIQEHQVNLEETDGLSIRFDLNPLIENGVLREDETRGLIDRVDSSIPMRLPIGDAPQESSAVLSLFRTCPEFPSHGAVSGMLEFTEFTLQLEAADTGLSEHLAGTLTATLARPNAPDPVGTLRSSFDFDPPRRPLTTFR